MNITVRNHQPVPAQTLVTTIEVEGVEQVRCVQIALWRAIASGGHSEAVRSHMTKLFDEIARQTGFRHDGARQ